MDEMLATIALAVMVLSIMGAFNIKRAKKNDADVVYRMVGGRWIRVRRP